ncbi:expressed unknown protein [Seminavis robusta]|uniref:Hint domain-containing protein n=1 Tax=Seminavis robusta TaxID=568900 RepID=A0A9N8DF63_9STRA|nr:expressed unknown protein [Seminavis robusta]|eukprot:Sro114_g056450.1 n/a (485) ;mRNA; r:78486-79940
MMYLNNNQNSLTILLLAGVTPAMIHSSDSCSFSTSGTTSEDGWYTTSSATVPFQMQAGGTATCTMDSNYNRGVIALKFNADATEDDSDARKFDTFPITLTEMFPDETMYLGYWLGSTFPLSPPTATGISWTLSCSCDLPVTESPTAAPTEVPTASPTAAPTVASTTAPTSSSTVASTTAPTSDSGDNGGNGGLSGMGCFSESTKVHVQNKGFTLMKDLQIGDNVLTGGGFGYQPVYSFGHRLEQDSLGLDFYQIYTQGSGDSDSPVVEMTGNHLIFIKDNDGNKERAVRADQVQVGDVLVSTTKKMDQQYAVSKVTTTSIPKGLYMPLTPDGSIVVAANDNDTSGIVASTYVSIANESPVIVERIHDVFGIDEQSLVHWWLSPYRLMCLGVSSRLCQEDNNRSDEGILTWLLQGREFAQWTESRGFFAFQLISVPTFGFFAFCNLVEQIILLPYHGGLFGYAIAAGVLVMSMAASGRSRKRKTA